MQLSLKMLHLPGNRNVMTLLLSLIFLMILNHIPQPSSQKYDVAVSTVIDIFDKYVQIPIKNLT